MNATACVSDELGRNDGDVHTLHVLPPTLQNVGPARTATDPAPQTLAAPAGPARPRENASAGYRRALEAHLAAAPERRVAPATIGVAEGRTKALRG